MLFDLNDFRYFSNMSKDLSQLRTVPGSVIYTGKRKVDKISIHYMEYDVDHIHMEKLSNRTIKEFHSPTELYNQWYDIRGLHDTDLISDFGKTFKIHPLILEDIVDVEQRPKLDDYGRLLFLKMHAFEISVTGIEVLKENISIVLGDGFVLSFQENKEDLLFDVRKRLKESRGRIRDREADYLFFALIDTIVDYYFVVLEKLSHSIQMLEARIHNDPDENTKKDILYHKKQYLFIRKSIYPLREALFKLSRSENALILENTRAYLRDTHDHLYQLMESIDTNRDILSGLQDLYISEISLKMNQVMQILTIITTIFVPLSFLVGLYGMNFKYMPELEYRYSYFILWGIIILIVIGLLFFFKRKKWL